EGRGPGEPQRAGRTCKSYLARIRHLDFQNRVGSDRRRRITRPLLDDRRVFDQRAAMAVVAEMEVVDGVGAAEMQLGGMPRTILYREDAAAERYFRCRCRVDVVEIDGVIEIGL